MKIDFDTIQIGDLLVLESKITSYKDQILSLIILNKEPYNTNSVVLHTEFPDGSSPATPFAHIFKHHCEEYGGTAYSLVLVKRNFKEFSELEAQFLSLENLENYED